MKKFNYYLMQINPILYLVGYLFMHAFLGITYGGGTHMASVAFNGVLLAFSLYIIAICSNDFVIEPKHYVLLFLSVLMMLYGARIVYDIYSGPFSSSIPHRQMWNDVLVIVGGTFFPAWAIISSRKYLNIQIISSGVFWLGFFACLFVMMGMRVNGVINSFEDERLDVGRSLHSLSLARLGAIEVIAAFHMFLNRKRLKWFYLIGMALGLFVCLASGARGGVVGVVLSFCLYSIMSIRKKPFLLLICIIILLLFIWNLTSILEWLGQYFPVISNRMLDTIIEGDLSNRELLFQMALERIREHPIVGYGYRLKPDISGFGPHNGILDVVLCLGIPIGLLFVLVVYIKGLFISMQMMIDKHLAFPSLMAVFALVSSMSGSSLTIGSFDFAIAFLGVSYYYNFHRARHNPSHNLIHS